MKLKVKKIDPFAIIPTKAHNTDAGFDLYSLEDIVIYSGETRKIRTGISVEIPVGYCGVIFDRSSLGSKGIHRHAGIVDFGYTNEVLVCLHNSNLTILASEEVMVAIEDKLSKQTHVVENAYQINKGDRIAQLLILPVPEIEIEEVKELSESERAMGGFGSSGK